MHYLRTFLITGSLFSSSLAPWAVLELGHWVVLTERKCLNKGIWAHLGANYILEQWFQRAAITSCTVLSIILFRAGKTVLQFSLFFLPYLLYLINNVPLTGNRVILRLYSNSDLPTSRHHYENNNSQEKKIKINSFHQIGFWTTLQSRYFQLPRVV